MKVQVITSLKVVRRERARTVGSVVSTRAGTKARAASAMRPTQVGVDTTRGLVHRHVATRLIGPQSLQDQPPQHGTATINTTTAK